MHLAANAWSGSDSDGVKRVRASACRDLEARGVDIAGGESPTVGVTLLFTDEPGAEVAEKVSEFAADPHRCVLVVRVGDAFVDRHCTLEILAAGACDVIEWSAHPNVIDSVVARLERWNAVDSLLCSPELRDHLVGESASWIAILRQVVEVARFTTSSILLTGESGTGKEHVARLMHAIDPRPQKKELVVLDCTTIVPELSRSEFFGHERGAFTGAVQARDGAFGVADGGTLFLDEIGELPIDLQPEILRVVQEGTYKRLGSNDWKNTVFRLICATNRDLSRSIDEGEFRSDLYYRLATWQLRLPPLRERVDDVPRLAEHFLREHSAPEPPPPLDAATREFLMAREYPGNVRDLRRLVERMADRYVGPGPVTVGCIPPTDLPVRVRPESSRDALRVAVQEALSRGATLRDISSRATQTAVDIALAMERGSVKDAAARLQVTPRTIQLRNAARKK